MACFACWVAFHLERRRQSSFVFSRLPELLAVGPGLAGRLRQLPGVLRILALTLFVLALARPFSAYTVVHERQGEGIEIMIALDVSGSMRDTDLAPSRQLRKTRLDVAKELTYTGREVDGNEARELGLVTRVCDDPLSEALALAAQIVDRSPHAIRAAKQLLQETRHGDVPSGLKMEETLQRGLIGSPNQIEAVKANFEKRAPDFIDPD